MCDKEGKEAATNSPDKEDGKKNLASGEEADVQMKKMPESENKSSKENKIEKKKAESDCGQEEGISKKIKNKDQSDETGDGKEDKSGSNSEVETAVEKKKKKKKKNKTGKESENQEEDKKNVKEDNGPKSTINFVKKQQSSPSGMNKGEKPTVKKEKSAKQKDNENSKDEKKTSAGFSDFFCKYLTKLLYYWRF